MLNKDEGGMMKDEFLSTHGEGFPGEHVRALKEKEVKQFGGQDEEIGVGILGQVGKIDL